jgi:hypothetical protein
MPCTRKTVKEHNTEMTRLTDIINEISPYTLGSIWSLGLCWPLRRLYTPLATSAQAALAPL